ncbi:MAG: type VI secretion system protein TssA [Deltaproteobacteria bacterium CG_4_9_14_3_um_filter_65_9]|nr:MAG: type VI secretion system protein TssA [Deltaproteobacteria bacterium CG_4_9_14_3_um_filter_65_9]
MELAELGKLPIRPEQAAGDDARYDPLYEELVAEVDKFSSPSASGAVDWDKVVKLSSDILSQKSKDLLVASYLAIALIQTKKFEGVEIGSRVYRDLIESHWDDLFPTKARMRGRVAAIEWWAEKAESVLEQLPKGPFAEERINALNENLQKVDHLLSEYLEEAPSIRPLLDFVGSLEAIAPPPDPKASEPKPAAAPRPPEGSLGTLGTEPAAPRVEEGPVEITSLETAYAVLEKALGDVARVAGYLREENLSNPTAFRLARVAAWSAVESLPPSENGRTNIPAPYTADSLRALVGGGRDEALVRAAEQNLVEYIFWLDLNFWSSEGLARLGEEYKGAAEAVRGETALLLRRLPGLEDMKFSDGTPFAGDDTREWLKDLSAGGGGAAAGSGGAAADPAAKGVRQAREWIAEGRTAEAVRKMQQGVRGAGSRKEAFQWRVALCRVLIETPEARHALPHIEEILKEIDLFHLEEYDPELALKGLKVAWDGYRANAGLVPEERVAEIQGRIARVDVSAAISLGGE